MKTKILLHIVSLLFLTASCTKQDNNTLTIATAANMQFAIQEIITSFTQKTGIPCDVVITSSGKLTAQIQEGAPYDIFISADMKYPETLHKNGFTAKSPEIYAYGKLVLWSISDEIQPSIESLTDKQIKHIAMANPKTAPYGEAAIAVLKHAGIYDLVTDKLVYGESISQTNQFIISGAAQVGFTAKSVVLSPQMEGKGQWIAIDKNLYTPIAQGAVIIKKDSISEATLKFYKFLFSPKSKEILENFGYLASIK